MTAKFAFNRWLVREEVEQIGEFRIVSFHRTWLARLLRWWPTVRISGVVNSDVVRVRLAVSINGCSDATLIATGSAGLIDIDGDAGIVE